MANKLPYMPLYIGEWKKDPHLSVCSPATRGVWIDLLCAMHEDDRCGQVVGTVEDLAILGRCLPAQMKTALAELKAKKAAHVALRHGNVTVTNRKMHREYKERKANTLRQRKKRAAECNGNVTVPLSMSSSFSWSTVEGDPKCDSGGEGIETARRRANEVAERLGVRAEKPADRSLVLKAALLSMRPPFSEHWLYDAAEGAARSTAPKKKRFAYFHKCLADSAAKAGCTLNRELAKTKIPPELSRPPPNPPDLSGRLCVDPDLPQP